MDCPFCNLDNIRKLKVFRGSCTNAILNPYPITEGHLLIVPDVHVKSINELDCLQRTDLFSVVNSAVEIFKKSFSLEGVNVFFNEGEVAGQTLDHLHVHVVPRHVDDDFIIPGRKNGKKEPISDDNIKALKEKLLNFPK